MYFTAGYLVEWDPLDDFPRLYLTALNSLDAFKLSRRIPAKTFGCKLLLSETSGGNVRSCETYLCQEVAYLK